MKSRLRARAIRKAIEDVRAKEPKKSPQPRITIVSGFPQSVSTDLVRDSLDILIRDAVQSGIIRDPHMFEGSGFIGVDCSSMLSEDALRQRADQFVWDRLHRSELHPDAWPGIYIGDPAETEAKLAAVASDRYSYHQLDDFTDLIARTVQGAPEVAKIERKGVLPEQIFLDYSQERLASLRCQAFRSQRHSRRAQHHPAGWPARGRSAKHADRIHRASLRVRSKSAK